MDPDTALLRPYFQNISIRDLCFKNLCLSDHVGSGRGQRHLHGRIFLHQLSACTVDSKRKTGIAVQKGEDLSVSSIGQAFLFDSDAAFRIRRTDSCGNIGEGRSGSIVAALYTDRIPIGLCPENDQHQKTGQKQGRDSDHI